MKKHESTKSSDEQLIKVLQKTIDTELNKPFDEIDSDLVKECSDFIDTITKGSYLPDAETKEKRLKELKTAFENADFSPKRRLKLRLRNILVAVLVIFVLIVGSVCVTAAVNGTSFADFVRKLGADFFDLPYDEKIEIDGIEFVRNGKTATYSSFEEAMQKEGLDLLYPTWLPDGVYIEKFVFLEKESGDSVIYSLNTDGILIGCEISRPVDLSNYEDCKANMIIDGTDVGVYFIEPGRATFSHGGSQYTVYAADTEVLHKILENLK